MIRDNLKKFKVEKGKNLRYGVNEASNKGDT